MLPAPLLRSLSLLLALFPLSLCAQELCNNGIDDDGNGLIDLNDPACACTSVLMEEGTTSYIRNHSFEDRSGGTCCPFGFVSPVSYPWLSCAQGWIQPTGGTTDYMHTCGFAPSGMPMPPPDGQGAVGFYALQGETPWFEYIGTCLTYPAPANILQAGTTYTLSLWIAGAATNEQHSQTLEEGRSLHLFPDPLPLAIFGRANGCVPFPVETAGCIGHQPDWNELGRVMVQPAWDWVRVSITFTPTEDIYSVIIGGACDTPLSFSSQRLYTARGWKELLPYFLVDDLMLTEAGEQVLSPVTTSGAICEANVLAVAEPPAGAADHQWYRNGVALPGQIGTTLDVSASGLGGGLYTMASTYNGQCLMGAAHVPSVTVMPAVVPSSGCTPLAVVFANNTGGGFTTVSWDLGDGTTSTEDSLTHTYTEPGTYDVRLTVRNGAGCERDTLIENAVTVLPGVEGRITATPNPVGIGNPVVALSSAGSVGDIVSWRWDLGVADPPTATDPSLTAFFPAEAGSYPVTLVVAAANGCASTVRQVVSIPGLASVTPNVGGNHGGVTVDVTGSGFSPATTFALIRDEESIDADTTYFINSARLAIGLDLTGVDTGYWDVQVIEALDTFLIEAGFRVLDVPYTDSLLSVSLTGSAFLRPGFGFMYTVTCQNNGYNDAAAVPVWLTGLPVDAAVRIVNAEAQLDQIPWIADLRIDWDSTEPVLVDPAGMRAYLPVVVPLIKARSSFTLQVFVTAHPSTPADTRFDLEAWIDAPLLNSTEVHQRDASDHFAACASGTFEAVVGRLTDWTGLPEWEQCLDTSYGLEAVFKQMARQATGAPVPVFSDPLPQVISTSRAWYARFRQASACVQAFGGTMFPLPELVDEAMQTWKAANQGIQTGATVAACEHALQNRQRNRQTVAVRVAWDPNDKYGPGGQSTAHYVTGVDAYPYTIAFENDPGATLPAQFVTVIDSLDTEAFDLSTFRFTFVTVGYSSVNIGGAEKSFVRDIDLQASMGVNARVFGALDENTGVVTWNFQTIDPATSRPTTDPLGGFLPPDTLSPFGQGYVGFIVHGSPSLQEGDTIRNGATILFDHNEPIITPVWQTVVDTTPPVSHVLALPVTTQGDSVLVRWSGSDMLSGVYHYNVYVQASGADGYTKWRSTTSDTAAWFHGTIGTEYRFYSLATDSAGNVEVFTGYDAITRLSDGAGVAEWSADGGGMTVFPNPHSAHFTLLTTNPTAASGLLEIVDMTGRRVFQQQVRLPAGRHTLELQPDLAQGMYLLRLALPDREYSTRLVRQ